MLPDHLTLQQAHDLMARLMQVVGEELGVPLKLARARQITAELLGHATWDALEGRTAQDRIMVGAQKRATTQAERARRKHQIAVLQAMLNVPGYVAADVREAIAPPGYDPDQEDSLADRPSARRLNLPLNAEDELWLDQALALTAAFHRTVLPIYKIDPEMMHVAIGPSDDAQVLRRSGADDATLSAHERLDVSERKTRATDLVAALHTMIAVLGKPPFLFPRKKFVLALRRTKIEMGGRSFWTLLGPEPWLEMSYDVPGASRKIDVEWNASRSLRLLLGLRREFLDSGWTDDGPKWEITLREGKEAPETFMITAPDGGKAVVAVMAACASLRLANRNARLGTVVLLRARGPEGPLDPEHVVAVANEEPLIQRGKLRLAGKLVTKAGRHTP